MVDIKYIRENRTEAIKRLSARGVTEHQINELLDLDEQRRTAQRKIEEIAAVKNQANKKIPNVTDGERDALISQLTAKTKEEEGLRERLADATAAIDTLLRQIPNFPSADVPAGHGQDENEVIKTVGKVPAFPFTPLDHLTLGKNLGIIDTETAGTVSGARFGYLLREAALLQFALVQYSFSVLTDAKILKKIITANKLDVPETPFVPVVPPVLIKEEVLDKMARLEPKEERYYLPHDQLYLVGSAEHTMGPLHINETLPESSFPIRYIGYSTAFRREAGSYGKDTKGIFRVHQFDKIEIESFTTPIKSTKEQNFIIAIQEYLVKSLKLPYRIVKMCTGDMTAPDARQIDIEVWLPSQNAYRETHTSDLTTDYQSRRLNIRVKNKQGVTEFVHMNDATVFAIGRTIIALLENNQQADGSIKIPEVLQPYMHGKKDISRK